jgi:S-adenosylmethionine:tRNA ribosyltransferase-isomerase
MQTSDFDYELPPELIAQEPPAIRGTSRMMVVDRAKGSISHHSFAEFASFVEPGDHIVLNDTRVVPARFFSNDGQKEILRLARNADGTWKCLVRPGKKFRLGDQVTIGTCTGTVQAICEDGGERILSFDAEPDEQEQGHLALPPYITRTDTALDQDRYQTVFALRPGAIAAPTAGLHFTAEQLAALPHSFVTLHVGLGTFRPIAVDDPRDHHMHREWYDLSEATVATLAAAQRTIAIGTTVVRVLETCARNGGGTLVAGTGETDIFLYPPHQFAAVDALLTNFHLPRSTLLMLVSAFAGRELVLEAYAEAVRERYRFFSYGDCMLFL